MFMFFISNVLGGPWYKEDTHLDFLVTSMKILQNVKNEISNRIAKQADPEAHAGRT